MRAGRLLMVLGVTCCSSLWLQVALFAQQVAGTAPTPGQEAPAPSTFTPDFEVKIRGDGFLVRRKGTQEWINPGALNEPILVGALDNGPKIYLATKAIKLPKPKHTEDPEFPESERRFRNKGWALLHVIVDDKGKVRQPVVDACLTPAFGDAAINAVSNWTFTPATLGSEAVAVLMRIEIKLEAAPVNTSAPDASSRYK